ncbi:MAG: hypothetical protein WC841_01080 [Candidatus Shapirobacteria bacterium]|jgi:hypothetical protein
MQKNIDEFAKEIGLTNAQSAAVKEFILDLVVDNLKSMKDEYNQEIDTVIDSLSGIDEKK